MNELKDAGIISPGFFDELDNAGILFTSGVPSEEVLRELWNHGQVTGQNVEYGAQVLKAADKTVRTYWHRGHEGGVDLPRETQPADFPPIDGVFFHTHPLPTDTLRDRFLTLLPSDSPEYMTGDFISYRGNPFGRDTQPSRRIGRGMNVVHPYGMTLHLGSQSLSSAELKAARPYGKPRDADHIWIIRTGPQSGYSFHDERVEAEHLTEPLFIDQQPVTIMSRIDPELGVSWNFAVCTTQGLDRLSPYYKDMNNLIFGDGVSAIAKKLQPQVDFGRNLSQVAKNGAPGRSLFQL